ncbi:MAG: rRNA maturation RNase YbeY [Elusimicrobia bacterium CG1_02_63_36]|nr:MAG: rRNA maturation RNase YbeY [Elusimicrobia bacterium CG1_02_63_36]PIP84133.1 MAG: rRNA maturation RNase YbeY [Elusimicrobia bacterium CG22_combo_CG10-13_8_21_14_all_63_91]PJA16445.1 MAG: rRNA maturation RNase YbeY [Elusimicrobia bacterium CG_4_10_14_0_2_um_filter_63_34]PJB25679.1 MAG: rRNA maturation RNase YbeY [Elusimicrobia bacterium CG_4_9_14_3_um_filter_62_55]
MNVTLFGTDALAARERGLLREAVLAALGPKRRRGGEVCLILIPDKKIHAINKQYLGHDYPTDVIAFPYEDAVPGVRRAPDAPFGDVYIGLGVAKRQAKEMGHPLFKELVTLAVHGSLHLAGYDDRAPAKKEKMFARQNRLVARLLPDGKKKTKTPPRPRR